MQKKDNAPNNQLKKSQQMKEKKGKPSAKKIVSRIMLSKGTRSKIIPSPPYSQP
jgi:hypothetical protein